MRKSGNTSAQIKIAELLQSIRNTTFEGIGKPEPFKYEFAGKWSGRINYEHRIVYEQEQQIINIYSSKGHYYDILSQF